MKTREEILKGKYLMLQFVFDNDTPKDLAKKIIELINSKERVILDYGNTETKESWNEQYDIVGRIGYSKGYYGFCYPILAYSSRSIGGGAILTNRILSIKSSRGKRVIYSV